VVNPKYHGSADPESFPEINGDRFEMSPIPKVKVKGHQSSAQEPIRKSQ
jgi:hypothetical protein